MPPATECAATPERCFRVTDHATDIVAFMRGKGIQRASLVGHSLGSLIAQEIALSNPGMVERAVLIGTGATVVGNPVIYDFLERGTIEATWKPEIEAKGKRFPQDLYDLPLREVSPKMEEWLVTSWGADPVENPTSGLPPMCGTRLACRQEHGLGAPVPSNNSTAPSDWEI